MASCGLNSTPPKLAFPFLLIPCSRTYKIQNFSFLTDVNIHLQRYNSLSLFRSMKLKTIGSFEH